MNCLKNSSKAIDFTRQQITNRKKMTKQTVEDLIRIAIAYSLAKRKAKSQAPSDRATYLKLIKNYIEAEANVAA